MIRSLFYSLSLLLLLSFPAFSEEYSPLELQKLGIDIQSLKLISFSGDNKTLFSIERVKDDRLRAKDIGWMLRILNLTSKQQLSNVISIPLTFSELDSVNIDESGKTGVIVADYGTKLLSLDLVHRRVHASLLHTVIPPKDPGSKKSWTLPANEPYVNTYLSKDGLTAVIAAYHFKTETLSFFYEQARDNFTPHPLPGMQGLPLGVFRLSPDATTYAFLSPGKLILGTLLNKNVSLHYIDDVRDL